MRLASAATAFLLLATTAFAQCVEDAVEIRDEGTRVRFSVEVADTPAARAQGLMFREDLPRFTGMLFVFDAPHRATFWMENTPLPLDMLFFDEAGVLKTVHENAEPFSREMIIGGDGILYVLEINGGMAGELGIAPGAEMRHPALDPDVAAWPC
jgi:uncharacterized protein